MMNLLRAAFWISVVAFFMPGDPTADALAGSARDAASTARDLAADNSFAAVAGVCFDSPELCSAGVSAVDDAQQVAVQGLDALAAVLGNPSKNY
jgi:hypothetical protein